MDLFDLIEQQESEGLDNKILTDFKTMINTVGGMNIHDKVSMLNEFKKLMHDISPFNTEPVDCVLWVKNDTIEANDYNPNLTDGGSGELNGERLTDAYVKQVMTRQ